MVKYREMLYFDFETAIYLKKWNRLPSLIDEARPIITDKLCSNFMESILISNAPMQEKLRVVKVSSQYFLTSKVPFPSYYSKSHSNKYTGNNMHTPQNIRHEAPTLPSRPFSPSSIAGRRYHSSRSSGRPGSCSSPAVQLYVHISER